MHSFFCWESSHSISIIYFSRGGKQRQLVSIYPTMCTDLDQTFPVFSGTYFSSKKRITVISNKKQIYNWTLFQNTKLVQILNYSCIHLNDRNIITKRFVVYLKRQHKQVHTFKKQLLRLQYEWQYKIPYIVPIT